MACPAGEQPPFKTLFIMAVLDHPIVFGILFGLMFIAIGYLVHNFRQFNKELSLIKEEDEREEKEEESKKDK